jgi:DNA-binding transcriptional MerR regulator
MHQIGEAAARVGLSLRTVRYYEEIGLVAPSGRTDGGFRLYTDSDIERLALVKQMKPLDFSLEEMRDLLGVREDLDEQEVSADRRDELIERLSMYASAARERVDALREQLEAVEAFASKLRAEVRSKKHAPAGGRR